MMKRYASSFDAEDFKVVLLFDVAPSSSSPSSLTSTLPNVCAEGEVRMDKQAKYGNSKC
jgi:hypothetical protein